MKVPNRPEFPRDLRVLLVDGDATARAEATAMLSSCGYNVVQFADATQAAAELTTGTHQEFDVLLMDIGSVPADNSCVASIQKAIKRSSIPVCLMGANVGPSVLLQSMSSFGAVDLLEKPLSNAKLQTIWQHKVRLLLSQSNSGTPLARSATAPAAALDIKTSKPSEPGRRSAQPNAGPMLADAATPRAADAQQQQSTGSNSGPGPSHGAVVNGAESGSAASTSEAMRGVAVDILGSQDLDSNSFGLVGAGNHSLLLARADSAQVAGLASGLSHLVVIDDKELLGMGLDGEGDLEGLPTTPATAGHGANDSLLGAEMEALLMAQDSPPNESAQPQNSASQSQQPGVVRGHAAGRALPDLIDTPGMVWGIPTTPLHIAPRAMGPFGGMSPAPGLGLGGMPLGLPGMHLPGMGMNMGMNMGMGPGISGMPGMGPGMLPPGFMGSPLMGPMQPMTPPPGFMMPPGMQLDPTSMQGMSFPMHQGNSMPSSLLQPLSHPTPNLPTQQHSAQHMGHGMIPTPIASPPPQASQPTTPSTNRSRRTATHPKRSTSTPLPAIVCHHTNSRSTLQQVVDHPSGPPSPPPLGATSSGLLLDPLSALDDALGAFEPLDPYMIHGSTLSGGIGHAAVVHTGSDGMGAGLSDLDEWLMAPGGNDASGDQDGSGGLPLGLKLHKTPSLVDMIMAMGPLDMHMDGVVEAAGSSGDNSQQPGSARRTSKAQGSFGHGVGGVNGGITTRHSGGNRSSARSRRTAGQS